MLVESSPRNGVAAYEFGFLDENAKKEIRRACLKAIAIPGYQVPYASREMPISRGFGTGGLQITLSLIGRSDVLKVIDQGSDDSVNAVNVRRFVRDVCPEVALTTSTQEATLIQTRHRISEHRLNENQILILQVPYPDPLVIVEPNEQERRRMHGEQDYARLLVKLYEDIVQYGAITISHRYPVRIHGNYVIDPSPVPRYDLPALHQAGCLFLFGAGREKKIYAVPPYCDAQPLAFEDVRFTTENLLDEQGRRRQCNLCHSRSSFLERYLDDQGREVSQCSDADYCAQQLSEAGP